MPERNTECAWVNQSVGESMTDRMNKPMIERMSYLFCGIVVTTKHGTTEGTTLTSRFKRRAKTQKLTLDFVGGFLILVEEVILWYTTWYYIGYHKMKLSTVDCGASFKFQTNTSFSSKLCEVTSSISKSSSLLVNSPLLILWSNLCFILNHFEAFWSILKHFEAFWSILKHFEREVLLYQVLSPKYMNVVIIYQDGC